MVLSRPTEASFAAMLSFWPNITLHRLLAGDPHPIISLMNRLRMPLSVISSALRVLRIPSYRNGSLCLMRIAEAGRLSVAPILVLRREHTAMTDTRSAPFALRCGVVPNRVAGRRTVGDHILVVVHPEEMTMVMLPMSCICVFRWSNPDSLRWRF